MPGQQPFPIGHDMCARVASVLLGGFSSLGGLNVGWWVIDH
jgi:hypothetical protein